MFTTEICRKISNERYDEFIHKVYRLEINTLLLRYN